MRGAQDFRDVVLLCSCSPKLGVGWRRIQIEFSIGSLSKLTDQLLQAVLVLLKQAPYASGEVELVDWGFAVVTGSG